MRAQAIARDVGLNAAAAVFAAATLFPLVWMASVSLMPSGEAAQFPPPLLPRHATLEHYHTLFRSYGVGRYMLNSAILATLATGLALLFTAPAGYAFAKLRFRGRARLLRALLAALLIPGQIGTLPLFLMLQRMGLVNTFAGALTPWLASIFGLYIVRQYALSIPDDILEAARVDGANEFQVFLHVVAPALQPVLVTLAIFVFLGCWNDFFWPLIILTDQANYTLPVALAALARDNGPSIELLMAGAVLTMAPPLLLFLILQGYVVRNLPTERRQASASRTKG